MRNHQIAIQGSVASFHDLAAKKYFGEEVSVLECGSFKEVCNKITDNKVDYGVIAIENKVAGSILLNYQLIESYNLHIIGEIYLPIELQLLGKKGTSLKDIREIISHPMALGQSQNFLAELSNVVVTEYKDTATSAKLVINHSEKHLAVIAGSAVAEKYGLSVIKNNVADVSQNFTRFYIITKGENYAEDADKASITLQVRDEPGTLSEVLVSIKSYGLNISKIQSLPDPEKPGIFSFHFDIEFDKRYALDAMLQDLKKYTTRLKTLGIYKGEKHQAKIKSSILTEPDLILN